VSVARLLPDYEGAVAAGEGELRRWASQHLNVEIGLALRATLARRDLLSDCVYPGLTLASACSD